MFGEISGKQHTCLHAFALHILNHLVAIYAILTGNQESKPAWRGILTRHRKDKLILGSPKPCHQTVKIVASALDKSREFFQLCTANSCLHFCCLEVVSKMRVHIFVVIAKRQFSILFVETMTAQVVASGRTYTVTSPITERAHNLVKQRIVRVDSTTLSHCHMMRRIKTGSTDVSDGSSQLVLPVNRISGAECIAVVLDEPEVIFFTEILQSFQIKRISKRMCQHHRFCLWRNGFLKLFRVNVVLRNCHIHKHRDCSILNHRRYRCRESCCHRNHFVSRQNLTLTKKRGSQCHEREKICRRTGVYQRTETHLQVFCKLLLKLIGISSGREPELQRAVYEIYHFL